MGATMAERMQAELVDQAWRFQDLARREAERVAELERIRAMVVEWYGAEGMKGLEERSGGYLERTASTHSTGGRRSVLLRELQISFWKGALQFQDIEPEGFTGAVRACIRLRLDELFPAI